MIPNLTLIDDYWEGSILLEEWNKFYGQDLRLMLNIFGDVEVNEVTEIHERGYHYLISQQKEILESMLDAVFENYTIWQEKYGYDEQAKALYMPDILNAVELKPLLRPQNIHILDVEMEQMPYIGVEFECTWDREHGVGIMLYKNTIVEIGSADTAFMSWIAEEDKANRL